MIVAMSRTGRRPIQFESGTHTILDAPRNKTLTLKHKIESVGGCGWV